MIDRDRQRSGDASVQVNEESALLSHCEANGSQPVSASRSRSHVAPSWRLISKLLAVVVNFITTGLLQSAIGAMILNMEAFYDLKNGPTAFIFPSALAGYLIAITVLEPLHNRSGRRAVAVVGPCARLIGASVLMLGPRPFGFALLGYFVLGFGTGLTDAGFCAWGASMPRTNVVQGIMHGAWSTGCVLGPLVATRMLSNGWPWFTYYRFAGALCLSELIVLTLAFWPEDAANYKATIGADEDDVPSTKRHPLLLKETWLCGLFWFVYEGIESSYGDWIIAYMASVRQVDHTVAASAASIFWIGMVFGRVVLSPVTEYVGLPVSVATYIVLSAVAQLVFKAVQPVSVALILLAGIGFLFGPLFPSGIVLLGRKLPVRAHVGVVSVASAVGQIGGATAPLIVGFMADAFGIARLLDVVTALTVVLLFVWMWFCRAK